MFFKIGLHKLLMTYTESNHEKENIFWGMIFICLLLILISPILPSFDKKGKTALEVKAKLFSSQPLSRYKINVSEGETETEKS